MSWLLRLKSLAVGGLLTGLAAAFAAPAPNTPGGFNTPVPTAILIEAESGTVLFEKAADQLVAPASLAKLMTAEVVFDQVALGNIKLEEEFIVSANAWRKGGAPSGGSTMFAAIHSKIKVSDLLSGLVIHSGNDACIVLAEGIAGNEASFARLMNDRARELGLDKSNFTNSTGLPDPEQRVTVRELAKLAQHIIRTYPEQYKLYGEREFTWNKIRQQNRNPLLAHEYWRRRAQDRFHQRGGLRPGRLGGAEWSAPDCGGQRREARKGARRRGEEAAGMGFQGF